MIAVKRLQSLIWVLLVALGALGALAALAIFTSEQQRIATIFLAAMAAGFVLLRVVAMGIAWLAKRPADAIDALAPARWGVAKW